MILLGAGILFAMNPLIYAQSAQEVSQALDNFSNQLDQILQEEADILREQTQILQEQTQIVQEQAQLPFGDPSLDTILDQSQSALTRPSDQIQSGALDSVHFYMNKYNINHCEVNGKQVPCEELLADAAGFIRSLPFVGSLEQHFGSLVSVMLWVIGISVVLGLIGFIFWIAMLIDAIKHQKDNKAVWILVIVFGNILGALIYFFVEKLDRNKKK